MSEKKLYFVCILGSLSGSLYIGMTNSLERRIMQHKEHVVEGFTDTYDVDPSTTKPMTTCIARSRGRSN